ncbi:ATP-binding protein, partial [Vagococcus fluvialis]|uniref:sensor histidine kinase n=1 Tax=Vagococcus fluvialis TaxID=2738 RepID=UPI0032E3CF0D
SVDRDISDTYFNKMYQRIKAMNYSGPEINLKVELPKDLVLVQVDAILMEQVIFNLLENSVRYGDKNQMIQLKVEEKNQMTRIHVINKGSGEDVKLLHSLFENKEKDEVIDSKKGLGIGLSIVKTIITAHNGLIYVAETHDDEIDVVIELRRRRG